MEIIVSDAAGIPSLCAERRRPKVEGGEDVKDLCHADLLGSRDSAYRQT
jgi:hypothetical protein